MQTLLQLLNTSHVGNLDDLRPLATIARSILRRVRAYPSETPGPDSPALTAFDPRITRRLHTVMPTRELELAPQEAVWADIERLLDGWENVAHLRENHTLLAWQVISRQSWLLCL
jgi:N-alpha-acetyltransferase 35, NatC auxiliary subunit